MDGRTLFADLPPGAEGHFRIHMYALIARVLAHLRALDADGDPFARFPFLAGYHSALARYCPGGLEPAAELAWWQRQIDAWEEGTPGHLPLRALVSGLGLGAEELRLLLGAGLVEEDIRFGALCAALQEPLIARRPCVGLLSWLLGEPDGLAGDAWPACKSLVEHGLLLVENQADPRAEWLLRVPPPIWDALRGRMDVAPVPGLSWQTADSFPTIEELILPDELRRGIAGLPGLLANDRAGALVLRGMGGSGRRTVLGVVARSLGRGLLLREAGEVGDAAWRLLGPLATLSGALPALRCDPGPGETIDLPLLPGYHGPAGLALGRSGGVRGPLLANAVNLALPPPDPPSRRRFWQGAGAELAPGALDIIAGRFLLTGGLIRRAAPLATAYAQLDGRAAVELPDVQRAARTLNRQALETLAASVDPAAGWDDLVVGPAVAAELVALVARCRARERLRAGVGAAFATTLNRGVRALFTGPSGTGKTLAARALSAELQMDLYRVDLAAVVNKYIGETERNLNQVLSRAEELDVLLLLDEGDALMTRRTDVRSANDRYANLETNYLLQRLEGYEGVVIVTTNAGQRIDAAFMRRLDVVVEFAPPDAAERLLIWQRHLPCPSAISPGLVEEVSARCSMTGGQIRNAALHTALLALGDGRPPDDGHLEQAVQREYRQAGASLPLVSQPAPPGQLDRLRRFAAELG
jgi:hypothetical protein